VKHLFFYSFIIFLFACESTPPDEKEDFYEQIVNIESSIKPVLQIEGQEIPEYTIEDRLEELGIPGLSVAGFIEGELAWVKGYGMARVKDSMAVSEETLFLAGSISKPVAALRAHQLVEEGIFNLDDNVNNYLNSWQLPDNEFTETEKVTLRRILNHTAGLTVWGFPGYDKGDTIPTTVEVLDGKGNTDPIRVYKVPGESWMYSGGGYTIMQLMISDTENQPFSQTLQENVLKPLGMERSTFENPLPEAYHHLAATGYRFSGDEVEGQWPIYPEMAAAGLWTTPEQLIQWAIEIQKIYQSKEDGILDYGTVEEMLTPGMNNHGLGPGVNEHTFGHGGADEGFRADMTVWKEYPFAIVLMVNSDNGSIMQEIKLAFAEAFDLPGVEPELRKIAVLPKEILNKFEGRFRIEQFGNMNLFPLEGKLGLFVDSFNDTLLLKPENDSIFFDVDDGTRFHFKFHDDICTGFDVDGFTANRLEEK